MDIKPNRLGQLLRFLSLFVLIGTLLYLILSWPGIPDRIPGPLNSNGIPESYTGKTSLITLVAINWINYFTMTVMQHLPQLWAKRGTVSQRDKLQGYRSIKNRLGIVKFIIVGISSYLIIYLSRGGNLPSGILIFAIVFMFAIIGVFIYKLLRFTIQ